jgi:hypothetical protein
MLTPLLPSPTTSAASSRRLGRRHRGRRHDVWDTAAVQTELKSNVLNPFFRVDQSYNIMILCLLLIAAARVWGGPCHHASKASKAHPYMGG